MTLGIFQLKLLGESHDVAVSHHINPLPLEGTSLRARPWSLLRKILRGEIREQGVMHAETALEPVSFFYEVAVVLPEPPPDGRLVGESFEWLE